MRYLVTIHEDTLELDVEPRPTGGYRVLGPEGREFVVESLASGAGIQSLLVNGRTVMVLPSEGEVRLGEQRFAVRAENWQERRLAQGNAKDSALARAIAASMPGRIVRVLCEVGSRVEANAPLIVIEAMKMQNELCAKTDAIVRAVHVSVGQTVERGTLLVELE